MRYDEDAELERYIWNHFTHLMTDFERQVGKVVYARQKASAASNPAIARKISDRWGRADDVAVEDALSAGPQAFRLATCKRLLAAHGDQVIINRCPGCRKIVRTPVAKQCFWCGHDWHHLNA